MPGYTHGYFALSFDTRQKFYGGIYMKKLLSLVIIAALLLGFFAFGGSISIKEGIPKVTFTGDWQTIGATIGAALRQFINGFNSTFH